MKPTRNTHHHRTSALLAVTMLFAGSCGMSVGQGANSSSGLVFDQIEIADRSGDVKLLGDIDGDGLLDFVLGGFPNSPLSWWRWPDLRRTMIAPAHVEFTTDGVLADIDGDRDLDIVTPDGPEGVNLHWFENPRPNGDPDDGTLWVRHKIGAIGSWGKDVEAADFDGDGRMDIAARERNELMIFFQGSPGAWRKTIIRGVRLGEEGMTSGDIDGDGDMDLVLCGEWTSNPGGVTARDASRWRTHRIGAFDNAFKAVVTDLDQDGQPDILTSSSEHTADIAWFRADHGPTRRWSRHIIQPAVKGAHTLQTADMDRDGDIDVVVGQMHTTEQKTLAIHYNIDGRGTIWARQIFDSTGLHNGVVGDVGSDGDIDVFGSNWAGNPPLRLWINRLDPPASVRRLDLWTYHRITEVHVRSFGLAFADVDGDGRADIVTGPYWYRQPARPWKQKWEQVWLDEKLDAIAALDVDGDRRTDIIAQRTRGDSLELVWLEPTDSQGRKFYQRLIGKLPSASHDLGSQGHILAQIVEGGRPEISVSSGGGVFYFEIPDDPKFGRWRRTRICAEASDEGIAFADIDRDGLLDLMATTGDAKGVAWWRNPGDASADWEQHKIGTFQEAVFPDRIASADLDSDGRPDIIVSEENGKAGDAEAYWWRQPSTLTKAPWDRQKITSRGSLNSLSAADMDNDGDVDLILGEHRGMLRTSIWVNLGGARFIEQIIGKGIESHLGARTIDLDGDGDLDVVSIAWDSPGSIHVWRNDAIRAPLPALRTRHNRDGAKAWD